MASRKIVTRRDLSKETKSILVPAAAILVGALIVGPPVLGGGLGLLGWWLYTNNKNTRRSK